MTTYARPFFNSKNFWHNLRRHLAGWTIFMVYESFTIALASGSLERLVYYLLHYVVNILLFYSHAKIVMPLAMSNPSQKAWKIPLFTAMEIAFFLALKYGSDHLIAMIFPEIQKGEIIFDERFIYGGIWRSVYFILLASGYYFLKYYIRERDKSELLEKKSHQQAILAKEQLIELNNARNAFLRAQINPHFLFNTISFIYSKIHKTDPAAGKTLALLSRNMRYALRSGNNPSLVRVSEELKQIRYLLELWQIRQEGEVTAFQLEATESAENAEFIPLVLLTLVENIFKHGNLSDKYHPALLRIETDATHLFIQTRNLVNTGLNDNGQHTGLQNIRQRLRLSYGEHSKMQHYTSGDQFIVKITAPLNIPGEDKNPKNSLRN
ncbi:sensor histidine kinase [Pedobacter agri]|uniref:Histidine kinase n=2 Tax=Pedobacter agri TaxID=454586 RepID=A0A9X3DGT4_9SPHI|nr:histidine kinase [Pedobacter agri]MCX3267484.1 histidine kinase [Pedobacter agri]MDQ1142821.1 two-component system LytT family sensor kinase [Pedobacter agri]